LNFLWANKYINHRGCLFIRFNFLITIKPNKNILEFVDEQHIKGHMISKARQEYSGLED